MTNNMNMIKALIVEYNTTENAYKIPKFREKVCTCTVCGNDCSIFDLERWTFPDIICSDCYETEMGDDL